jgi:hypothetical protein
MKGAINAIIIAVAVVLFALITGAAFKYKYKTADKITVTGLAEKDFVSDLIVWTGNYSRTNMDLKAAYAALKTDESNIRTYLKGKGLADGELVFSAVDINKDFSNKTDESGRIVSSVFNGYVLKQTVKVESKSIEKVEGISREITELIEQGIEINSSAPAYFYSRLSELKIDLLAKASADAKNRAESIAKNAGSSLGSLKNASMGVFQITGKNSNEDYSYGGAFNTSSKNKTASITLKTEYAVD